MKAMNDARDAGTMVYESKPDPYFSDERVARYKAYAEELGGMSLTFKRGNKVI